MRPRLLALVALILALAASPPAAATAQTPPIAVTHIALDTSSFKVDFTPVDGAKDYRIYSTASPNSVKYAGVKRWQPAGTFRFRTVNNDGVHFVYPLEVESYTGASGNVAPNLTLFNNDTPMPEIEENGLTPGQPYTFVIQAVDALGPSVPEDQYDSNFVASAMPTFGLGRNAGPTPDGKVSTNGQGPPTDSPNVLAQSAPFTVTTNASTVPLPSGPEATNVFLDTFPDSENATILKTGDTTGQSPEPAGGGIQTYTMGSAGGPQWVIRDQAADPKLTIPFVAGHHFMDTLFDESPQASWASMVLTPQGVTPDLSDGGVLHMTMEVDSTLDYAGRRWLGFDIAPSTDPITDRVEPNYGATLHEQANATSQAIFVAIYAGLVHIDQYTGGVNNAHQISVPRVQNFPYNGLGLDNRSRFDLYLTQSHLALFEDGALLANTDLVQPVSWTTVTGSFSHYFYHSAAELVEEPFWAPWDTWMAKIFPRSDERHWNNMGEEVLPASDVPADWSTIPGLVARSEPAGAAVCATGWTCSDIGQTPNVPSRVSQDGGGDFTIHAGAVSPVANISDEQLLVSQPLPSSASVTAQLMDRANLSYWGYTGLQGIEARQNTTTNAPAYAVGMGGDGHLAVWWRVSAGAALQTTEVPTAATLPAWLRIVRDGTALSAQTSADGQTWADVAGSARTVALSGTTLGGLTDWEATSPNGALPAVAGTARFASVSVTGGTQPTPAATPTPTQFDATGTETGPVGQTFGLSCSETGDDKATIRCSGTGR